MATTRTSDVEKTAGDEKTHDVLSRLPSLTTASSASLDKAFVYAQQAELPESGVDKIEDAALVRKIDWRILPIAFVAYFFQALDKLNMNYAAIMGLNRDLKLVGNNFNDVASAINIAVLVAEVPTIYMVQRVPPGKWLAINMIVWGIVTACTAAVTNYHGLLACRIIIGIAEAATPPCLMMITSMWYTKKEAVFRFSIWISGLGFALVVGSLISYGFQHVVGTSLVGWRIMFILLGGITVAAGGWTLLAMPDSPMTANWLTEDEKKKAVQRVAANQTGIKNTHFKPRQLFELLLDPQIWIMVVMGILLSMAATVVGFYSSTLIRNFGYTSKQATLLNMPGGALAFISAWVGYFVSTHDHYRTVWIAALALLAAVGSGLMSFLPLTLANKPGLLIGVYLENVASATGVLTFSLVTANFAGHTKRAAATAIVTAAGAIGSIIGPQLFQAKDAPQYIPAKIVLMAGQLFSAFLCLVLFGYYYWQNAHKIAALERKKAAGEYKEDPTIAWQGLTDKENPTFRYIY
ncbi:major facilitator superfamily domain-containing protein [Mycena crocata]|nr:major facilitator superfamily domain-containing protein [Mycena crocata]